MNQACPVVARRQPWSFRLQTSRHTKRLETGPEFGHERFRLFPRRKVSALGEPVVPEQLGISALGPTLRGLIDLVRIGHHGYRDLYTPDVEEAALGDLPGVPIKTRRGNGGVGQPVEGDVVENVVTRQTLLTSIEDAH